MSLDLIKALRGKTGASLQACRVALDEAEDDEIKAIDILRKKGETKMADRTNRSTSEGVVASAIEGNQGVLIQLACETDFVAKNPDFVKAAQTIAEKFLQEGDAYDATPLIQELNLKMGEKVEWIRKEKLEGNVLGAYIHSNQKMGALVALEGDSDTAKLAKDLAMHVAAMNPWAIHPEEIDENILTKEREIWNEEIRKEGKPEAIWSKILEGKEKKFREDHALLTQPFVKNLDQKIMQLLNGTAVKGFIRIGA